MINSTKLFSRGSQSSSLTPRSIVELNLIRRDSITINSLLKENLVLSKVRYGIERRQQERERRRNREADLEADSKDNYEIGDAPNNPRKQRRGLGALLGTVFGGVVRSLGGVAFQAAPAFLLAGQKIGKSGRNFNRSIAATDGLLGSIKGQRGPFDSLRKVNLNPVKNIGGTITRFGNSLQLFVSSAIAGQVSSRAISRLRAPAQVKAQIAQQARVRQRSRVGARAGQIDIEEALQLGRTQANARAKARVNIMKRQQEIQAEAAAEAAVKKRRRKTKSSFKQLEFQDFRTIKKRRVPKEQLRSRKATEILKEKFGNQVGNSATATIDKPLRNFNVKNNEISFSGDDVRRYFGESPADTGSGRYNYKAGGFDFELIGTDNYNIEKTLKLKNTLTKKSGLSKFMNGDVFDFEKVFSVDDLESNIGAKARRDAGMDALLDMVDPSVRGESFDLKKDMKDKMRTEKFEKRQLERMQRSKISGTGKRGTDVTSSGRVGSRTFTKPDGTVIYRSGGLTSADMLTNAGQRSTQNMFRDMPKIKPEKVVAKKGLGKFLANIGGGQFLKPLKEFVGQGVKNIPFIGDLIGILLDVFVFGEPIQRALFMAGGSILGGFLGGLAGAIGGPPGVLIGSIIGGIGGDLLGGAFYDLLFRGGGTKFGERFPISTTKSAVKAGLYRGGFADFGIFTLGEAGREFVLDADSTAALERRSPGFLMALNNARGDSAIQVLRNYASYEGSSVGKESMIPIPFPIPSKESTGDQQIVMESSSGARHLSFISDLYRRG